MPRVEIAAQGWGVLFRPTGGNRTMLPAAGVTTALTDAKTGAPVTTYTTKTGSGIADVVTDSNGRIPGWVDKGVYTLTYESGGVTVTDEVHAVDALRTVVFASDYGVGDGTNSSDETSKWVAAFAAAANGGTVVWPAGTVISKVRDLVVPNAVHVAGRGKAASKFRFAPSGDDELDALSYVIDSTNRNASIHDCTIDGQRGTVGFIADASGSATLTDVESTLAPDTFPDTLAQVMTAAQRSGALVTGTGVPANTTIVSFDQAARTVTLSNSVTAHTDLTLTIANTFVVGNGLKIDRQLSGIDRTIRNVNVEFFRACKTPRQRLTVVADTVITYGDDVTGTIAFGASAADMKTALEALPSNGTGSLSVTRSGSGTPSYVYTVSFLAPAEATGSAMTGTGGTVVELLVNDTLIGGSYGVGQEFDADDIRDPTTSSPLLTGGNGIVVSSATSSGLVLDKVNINRCDGYGLDMGRCNDSRLTNMAISGCVRGGLVFNKSNRNLHFDKIKVFQCRRLNVSSFGATGEETVIVPYYLGTGPDSDSGAAVVATGSDHTGTIEAQENGAHGGRLGISNAQLSNSVLTFIADGNGGYDSADDAATNLVKQRYGVVFGNYYALRVKLDGNDLRAKYNMARQRLGFYCNAPLVYTSQTNVTLADWYRIASVAGGADFTPLQKPASGALNTVGTLFQARGDGVGSSLAAATFGSGSLKSANDGLILTAVIKNQCAQIDGTNARGFSIKNDGARESDITVNGQRIPGVVAKSAVAVPRTGATTEAALATITIPGGWMGPDGRIRVIAFWSCTNSANNKTLRVRLGGLSGTAFMSTVVTTVAASRSVIEIANRGATNSQIGGPASGGSSTTVAPATASLDTTADQDLVISGQLANSGETMTLESYTVEIVR